MAETWTMAEIILCGVAALGCGSVAVMFFKALDIPPECCTPSQTQQNVSIDIESELIQ